MKETIKTKPKTKICKKCNRELPLNTDYFFKKCDTKDGYASRCKECAGRKFTNKLTHIPKDGYQFCKKCDRELPYTFQYFPEDKTTKTGLRNVCRECNPSYGRFLKDDEYPHRKWTNEEIQLLKEVYHDYTGKELQIKYFPTRSIRSIETMANILDISWKTDEAKDRARKFASEIVSEKFKGRDLGQEWRDKISATKKEYFKTHDGWWKGKKRSSEQCRMISKRMQGKWAGDKNPRHLNPLNGELNGRWKGGIVDTYRELRSETKEWFNNSMEFCKYKCVITNGDFDNVHHTTAFKDIVDQVFELTNIEVKQKVCDYTTEDFDKLRSCLKELHDIYGYGACLNKDVHKLFHDNYGYTNITPNDFLDFIYRIDIGVFDNWFKENNLQIKINYEYVKYLEEILFYMEETVAM